MLILHQLVWTKGHERIPNNWYKRNAADQYSIPYCMYPVSVFAANAC